ncbi:MAG: Glu-tRNA(Gln) amidotransferase subunit GatD [Thermoplasmata archaeon]|nr:Glu-tRNA(Gln) amidotransferase subunit GatD [Thermoplasmata archaeon]
MKTGDFVEIEKNGRKWKGIVMPHHAFSDKNIIVLKLEKGYNIGIDAKGAKIKVIKEGKEIKRKKVEIRHDEKKPTIALIGTGGTIASYVDYKTGAVRPAATTSEIAFSMPKIFDICNIEAKVMFQKLSENIKPRDWKKIAREAARKLNEGKSGVIVSHGTDTMTHTSAALAFMLKNLNGPVILVGSQRSSDRPSSDAFDNLIAAEKVALTDLGEVVVVMHGGISSGKCYIHRGTKVRKMHSSRRDAFVSINNEPIGIVENEVKFLQKYRKKSKGKTRVDDVLNENVALVYFHPALRKKDFENIVDGKDGIVIAGTGLGHVNDEIITAIKKLIKDGIMVVMTTQCFYGSVNMNVYSTGRKLIKAGVINGKDMLPEVALIKLMWALAHENAEELMIKNIAGEMNERRSISPPKSK